MNFSRLPSYFCKFRATRPFLRPATCAKYAKRCEEGHDKAVMDDLPEAEGSRGRRQTPTMMAGLLASLAGLATYNAIRTHKFDLSVNEQETDSSPAEPRPRGELNTPPAAAPVPLNGASPVPFSGAQSSSDITLKPQVVLVPPEHTFLVIVPVKESGKPQEPGGDAPRYHYEAENTASPDANTFSYPPEKMSPPPLNSPSSAKKTAISPAEKTPSSPVEKFPISPTEKTPSSPAEKTPSSPVENAPSSPAENTPSSPVEKTPSSPVEKTPSSPVEKTPSSQPVNTPSSPTEKTLSFSEKDDGQLEKGISLDGKWSSFTVQI
nr:proteoglycan 4-like [Procambarus clarkii]